MPLSTLPAVAESVALLADVGRTPGPDAPHVDRAVMQLVQAYTRNFLLVSGCHRAGESPTQHLQRAKGLGESARSRFAVRCLGDETATSAITKELAFADVPLNEDGSFESADLGCGTAVLSIGAAIAGLRAGAESVILNIVDCEDAMLEIAADTLDTVRNDVKIRPICGDITENPPYDSLDVTRIRQWITETISNGTPRLVVKNGKVIFTEPGTHRHDIDPFPQVVECLMKKVPELPELVTGGRVRMFPDIFNGLYQPGDKNVLRLLTSNSHSTHGPLASVGWDFRRYATIHDDSRW